MFILKNRVENLDRSLEEHKSIYGPPAGEAPVVARLKWFNGPKGFGFVIPDGRDDVDAFLHITTLQEIGVHAVGEGAVLLCHIQYGTKGAHVMKVVEIIDQGIMPNGANGSRPAAGNGKELGATQEMNGTVKWYKEPDGFGFIVPEDGLKDVFIHKTCLDRHGIDVLKAGQRLIMTFRNVPKGREVVSFRLQED